MGKMILTARIDANNIFKGDVSLSDASVRRIIDAYRGLYFPDGINTAAEGEPPVYRPATDQEVVLRMADGIVAGLRANARRVEQDAAKKVAEDAVTEIPADPAVP